MQTGFASRNGIFAALLAREGATVAETSLEGRAGFYQAFAGTAPNHDLLAADLGSRFLIMEARSKTYPVCGLEQTPVDLASTLAVQHAVNAKHIARIVEIMPEDDFRYPGTNHPGPFASRSQATMSAQFCAAAAFLGKPVMSYAFYDTGYADPEVADLAGRIS